MSKVSVIIPCFNGGRYLEGAIQSVLEQTYQDFEIVVVDDGSTDNTRAVTAQFDDGRVQYIFQENKGLASARNTGIRQSTGEYLAFLDADDRFLPHKLSSQVSILNRDSDVGLAVATSSIVNEDGKVFSNWAPWTIFPKLDVFALLQHCPFGVHTTLGRRRWVERVGLFDERLRRLEDWDLWLRLAVEGCRMEWDKQTVCVYRLHHGNMSRDAKLMGESALQVLDKLYSLSDLPNEVAESKIGAYAAAYAHSASRFYVAGEFQAAQANLRRAVELNPQLLEGEPATVVDLICRWAYHPFVEERFQFLADVESNFPPILPNLRRHFQILKARAQVATAFEAHSAGNPRLVRKSLTKGIMKDHSWLRNRGVWSIGVEAILGVQVAGLLRRAIRHWKA